MDISINHLEDYILVVAAGISEVTLLHTHVVITNLHALSHIVASELKLFVEFKSFFCLPCVALHLLEASIVDNGIDVTIDCYMKCLLRKDLRYSWYDLEGDIRKVLVGVLKVVHLQVHLVFTCIGLLNHAITYEVEVFCIIVRDATFDIVSTDDMLLTIEGEGISMLVDSYHD